MIYIKPIADVLQRCDSVLGFPPEQRVHAITITTHEEDSMNSKQTIEAKVIDTNHRLRGWMNVDVEFHQNLPVEVIHDGKTYTYTGKDGVWMSTGHETREMATIEDARLWITLDGRIVLED
jgi:hypothetical protein